jgi:MYXO-CTERM domain-containing protein
MLPPSSTRNAAFALAIGFACAGFGCSGDGVAQGSSDDSSEDPSASNQAAVAAGSYGATYVSQSFPLATTTLKMTAGQAIPSNIVLKNSGTANWDSNTRIGTTQPRDRASAFADSTWVNAGRPSAVTGTVAPGATFKFSFDLKAPTTPGTYDEFFGVVEDGVVWFSDPGQNGPPDNDIEVKIEVSAAPPVPDAGPSADDAGTDDGGPISVSQIPEGADGGDGVVHDPSAADPSTDGQSGAKSGGCTFSPSRKSSDSSSAFGLLIALGIGLIARRRRA